VGAGAVWFHLAMLGTKRECIRVAKHHLFGHSLKGASFLFQHFGQADAVGICCLVAQGKFLRFGMAVLCLLSNTPWPWPTPAEAASARGGFPTVGTEWRGRSEAEVCTSEARKIRVPLARARGGASQEGLVSLLGAERMRSHFVVAVANGGRG
jgi:hypothetical protein